jgi:hypothetical protein
VVAAVEGKEKALHTLESLGKVPDRTPDGPIKLGGVKTLLSTTIISKLAGPYLAHFRRRSRPCPTSRQPTEHGIHCRPVDIRRLWKPGRLGHVREVTFGEDGSTVRTGHAMCRNPAQPARHTQRLWPRAAYLTTGSSPAAQAHPRRINSPTAG